MELKSDEQKAVSVLEGDGSSMRRILGREPSVGQSSRVFYRSAEGIPFKWEMQPGTPIHPQQEDEIPPVCPSPLMRSMGLPLPNLDRDDPHQESSSKMSKIWSLRKMVKKRIITSDISKKLEMLIGRSGKPQESSRFGDSSFCSDSSLDSSFSSHHDRVADLDGGPFCCSPWNVPAILEEGKTRIYYCSKHKTAFAVEEDGSFLATILSRSAPSTTNTHHEFSGPLQNEIITPAAIPFTWETQPGTPKRAPENDIIPPPSPPPAVQSLGLPLPKLNDSGERPEAKESKWSRAHFWRRRTEEKKGKGKREHEMSFRYDDRVDEASFRTTETETETETGSVSSLLGKGAWRVSRIRRRLKGGCSGCGPWSRRDILVFARTKFKSFIS